jgi:spermidine/putrescine-binding protein
VIRARMASKDPNARYAAPYLWGRIGLLVDREKAEAALGKPLESSWSMVLDPDNASKLAQCGISFLDARDYAYSIAMNYRGENLDFPTRTSVRRYSQLMMTLRPYYKVVDAAAHLDMVPKGELCVSMVWEGDANVLQAGNDKLEFILPSEGTVMFVDTMAITRRAQNPEGARRWVEFMMREENAQRNAEYTGYNSPLQAVYDRMTENLDEAARKAKNEFSRVPTFMSIQPRPDINDMIAKAWNTFVSGDKLVAADSSKVVSYQ